jgi:hypothetical protein
MATSKTPSVKKCPGCGVNMGVNLKNCPACKMKMPKVKAAKKGAPLTKRPGPKGPVTKPSAWDDHDYS